MKTKLKLFNGTVVSVFLHGSKAWIGFKEVETKLRVLKSNYHKKIMSVQWFDHVTEEEFGK